MIKNNVLRIGKGIRHFMNEKFESCREILSSARNRLILGLIFSGLGLGLIASAYLRVPN